jgi:hypothetical protein
VPKRRSHVVAPQHPVQRSRGERQMADENLFVSAADYINRVRYGCAN